MTLKKRIKVFLFSLKDSFEGEVKKDVGSCVSKTEVAVTLYSATNILAKN